MKNLRHPVAIVALAVGFAYRVATVSAEPIRVAMPSKSLTFLNYYLADKFGLFKAEGLEGTFRVGKADVQLAAVVSGEMESSRRAEPFYAAPRRDYRKGADLYGRQADFSLDDAAGTQTYPRSQRQSDHRDRHRRHRSARDGEGVGVKP